MRVDYHCDQCEWECRFVGIGGKRGVEVGGRVRDGKDKKVQDQRQQCCTIGVYWRCISSVAVSRASL